MRFAAQAILLAIAASMPLAISAARAETTRRDVLLAATTTLKSATLDATRSGVAEPIERALYDLPGAEAVIAITRAGQSTVLAKLRVPESAEAMRAAAQGKLDQLRPALPSEADSPSVTIPAAGATPVAYFAISSDTLTGVDVTAIARQHIVQALKTVPNVAEVKEYGLRVDIVVAALDPRRLAAYGLTRARVEDILRRQTGISIEAIGPNDIAVHETHSRLPDPETLSRLVLKMESGAAVRLRNVAVIERRMRAPEEDVRVNGRHSFLAAVFVSEMGLHEASVYIRDSLPAILRTLPVGLDVRLVYACAACAETRRR